MEEPLAERRALGCPGRQGVVEMDRREERAAFVREPEGHRALAPDSLPLGERRRGPLDPHAGVVCDLLEASNAAGDADLVDEHLSVATRIGSRVLRADEEAPGRRAHQRARAGHDGL